MQGINSLFLILEMKITESYIEVICATQTIACLIISAIVTFPY